MICATQRRKIDEYQLQDLPGATAGDPAAAARLFYAVKRRRKRSDSSALLCRLLDVCLLFRRRWWDSLRCTLPGASICSGGSSVWAARTRDTAYAESACARLAARMLEDGRAYLFMSNHASNLDPPVITPLLGRRISIIAKQELFKIPFFGRAMRAAGFVAVNRANSRAAPSRVFVAPLQCCNQGMGMLVFPEGTRSPDGRLLPFKKGPFHLAMEAGVPVVPITIVRQPRGLAEGKHVASFRGGCGALPRAHRSAPVREQGRSACCSSRRHSQRTSGAVPRLR